MCFLGLNMTALFFTLAEREIDHP